MLLLESKAKKTKRREIRKKYLENWRPNPDVAEHHKKWSRRTIQWNWEEMSQDEKWEISQHRRIDAFELWCWRRLLRVPWTARRSNLSILKEISPEYSLEELMLKLKLQDFGHLMQRTDSLEKTWMLEKIKGTRRRGQQRMSGWMVSPTQWTWVWTSSRSWWWTGKPGVLQSVGSQRVRHDCVSELNWVRKTSWSWSLPSPDWKSLPKALHRDESTGIQRSSS